MTGVYRLPDGRISMFDPSLLAEGGGLRPDLFENPGLLEAGSLPMSPISGPWYATLDVGLRKNIPVGFSEAARLQLRIDFFNILNRTNFNVTGASGLGITNRQDPNDPDFGLFSDTFAARAMQVGMKLTF